MGESAIKVNRDNCADSQFAHGAARKKEERRLSVTRWNLLQMLSPSNRTMVTMRACMTLLVRCPTELERGWLGKSFLPQGLGKWSGRVGGRNRKRPGAAEEELRF